MNLRIICILLISAGVHAGASAQLFKCKGADGRYAFQDFPCAASTTDVNPRRKPAAEPHFVPPPRDNSPGANWNPGPRSTIPASPSPVAPPVMQPPPSQPPQVAQERTPRKPPDLERQQADKRKAEDEKAAAFNRMQRCNHARQQLGVAKAERPIYSYDNKGDRQYVSDENRQATVKAAERRVTEECN